MGQKFVVRRAAGGASNPFSGLSPCCTLVSDHAPQNRGSDSLLFLLFFLSFLVNILHTLYFLVGVFCLLIKNANKGLVLTGSIRRNWFTVAAAQAQAQATVDNVQTADTGQQEPCSLLFAYELRARNRGKRGLSRS